MDKHKFNKAQAKATATWLRLSDDADIVVMFMWTVECPYCHEKHSRLIPVMNFDPDGQMECYWCWHERHPTGAENEADYMTERTCDWIRDRKLGEVPNAEVQAQDG